MKAKLLRLIAAFGLLLVTASAHAAVSCNVSSSGFTTGYDPALATRTTVQTSVAVTCSRSDPANDPVTVPYTIKADNGLNPNGINNRALLPAASFLRYDAYMDSACATQWKGNTTFSGTINFSTSSTNYHTYWGCVVAAQTGLPAGTYTDTVTMTLSYGANPQSTAIGMFGVAIATPWTCSISSPPATLAFAYVAYQSSAASSSVGFGVTCTAYLPYTLSVSPAGGTIAGLTYTLAPSAASGTGTGSEQGLSINGSMPAGQPGTCALGSCTGANPHTLTLTY